MHFVKLVGGKYSLDVIKQLTSVINRHLSLSYFRKTPVINRYTLNVISYDVTQNVTFDT